MFKIGRVITLLLIIAALTACTPIAPGLQVDGGGSAGVQVGLIFTPAEGEVVTRMATVEPEATALDALEASGVQMTVAQTDFGPAICAILEVGQPEDNCFGDTEGRFWALFILNADGEWETAQVGAGDLVVENEMVLGFAWTGSDANYNPVRQPPVHLFDELMGGQ